MHAAFDVCETAPVQEKCAASGMVRKGGNNYARCANLAAHYMVAFGLHLQAQGVQGWYFGPARVPAFTAEELS